MLMKILQRQITNFGHMILINCRSSLREDHSAYKHMLLLIIIMPVKRGRGRIAELKKYIEDVHLEMRLFCLTPTIDSFNRITTCKQLVNSLGDNFNVWKDAAMFKFDYLNNDANDTNDTNAEFITLDEQICSTAINTPTRAISVKLMYMFHATGELKYIDLYYQTLGHKKMPYESRKFLATLFAKVKDEFSIAVPKLLQEDSDHFSRYDVKKSDIDFSYFARIEEHLPELKENQSTWKDLFTKIADDNNQKKY